MVSLIGTVLLASVVLFAVTSRGQGVAATVADDPALPSIEIDGERFHGEVHGDPATPALVVLHGGPGGDYRSLLKLSELADRFQVVFFDQRGAGLSQRVPQADLTYQGALRDLDALIERFGSGRPVVLVGHSWGAMLASGYLSTHPEKVEKAVLIEPGALNSEEFHAFMAEQRKLARGVGMVWTQLVAGFEALHVRGPDAQARGDYLYGRVVHAFANHPDNPYHCPGQRYDAPSWRFGTQALLGIQSSASDDELDSLSANASQFDGPVLFMAGSCDSWIGADLQARHAQSYPNARLVVIEGAGHEVLWDQPETSLAAIRTFLTD